jgi:hypothetical protein
LDMVFGEHSSRAGFRRAAQNFTRLRRMACLVRPDAIAPHPDIYLHNVSVKKSRSHAVSKE